MVKWCGHSSDSATGIRCRAVGKVILPGKLAHAVATPLCRISIEAGGHVYPVIFRGELAEKAAVLKINQRIALEGDLRPHSWNLDNGGEVTAVTIEPETLEIMP